MGGSLYIFSVFGEGMVVVLMLKVVVVFEVVVCVVDLQLGVGVGWMLCVLYVEDNEVNVELM